MKRMRRLSRTENLLFCIGALMMVAGAAAFLFDGRVASVVFAVGVLLFGCMQLRMVYEGRNFVIARLRRQQLFGSSMLVLAAVAMVAQTFFHYNVMRYNEWVVCLLIGAVIQLYTAFRIPNELEKEK